MKSEPPPLREQHIPPATLAELERMIAEIVRTSPYGIVILYIEDGRLTRATPGMIGRVVMLKSPG